MKYPEFNFGYRYIPHNGRNLSNQNSTPMLVATHHTIKCFG